MKNKTHDISTKLDDDKVLYIEDLCKFFRVNERTFKHKLKALRKDYPDKDFLFRWFSTWFLFESDLEEFINLLTSRQHKRSVIEIDPKYKVPVEYF